MEYNLGVDIGGTFTDCVVVDEAGELTVGKALSTPDNFAMGVLNAVRNAAEHLGMTGEEALLHAAKLFFHGCTGGGQYAAHPLGSPDRAHHHQGLCRQHLHDAGADDRGAHRGRDRPLLRLDQTRPAGAAAPDRGGEGARGLQGRGGGWSWTSTRPRPWWTGWWPRASPRWPFRCCGPSPTTVTRGPWKSSSSRAIRTCS